MVAALVQQLAGRSARHYCSCACKKEKEGKKPPSKAPKIQRLVTPISLQRKRHRLSLKKNQQLKAKAEAAAYEKLVAQRKQEAREKHNEKVSQRRSARSSRASEE